jgi:hypothetical protein
MVSLGWGSLRVSMSASQQTACQHGKDCHTETDLRLSLLCRMCIQLK